MDTDINKVEENVDQIKEQMDGIKSFVDESRKFIDSLSEIQQNILDNAKEHPHDNEDSVLKFMQTTIKRYNGWKYISLSKYPKNMLGSTTPEDVKEKIHNSFGIIQVHKEQPTIKAGSFRSTTNKVVDVVMITDGGFRPLMMDRKLTLTIGNPDAFKEEITVYDNSMEEINKKIIELALAGKTIDEIATELDTLKSHVEIVLRDFAKASQVKVNDPVNTVDQETTK